MIEVLLQVLPFFAIIGLGYGAGRSGFFPAEATAWLTKFVFYFALSAMLIRFSANLSFAQVWDSVLVISYFAGTLAVYLIGFAVALARKRPVAEAAVEAQCACIGNTGFLGIPMFVLLFGEASVGPVMLMLAVDLIFFGSLIVILITGSRDGRIGFGILRTVGLGVLKNPMVMSISFGLIWSASGMGIPTPVNSFLVTLGAAATPGALFAIGASLASKSAERVAVAGWLSFAKLVLHPAAIALCALVIWPVDPYAAMVMVAVSALPVAGNIYIQAAHYGVAPQRVSATILISTAASIVTLSAVIAWVTPGGM